MSSILDTLKVSRALLCCVNEKQALWFCCSKDCSDASGDNVLVLGMRSPFTSPADVLLNPHSAISYFLSVERDLLKALYYTSTAMRSLFHNQA